MKEQKPSILKHKPLGFTYSVPSSAATTSKTNSKHDLPRNPARRSSSTGFMHDIRKIRLLPDWITHKRLVPTPSTCPADNPFCFQQQNDKDSNKHARISTTPSLSTMERESLRERLYIEPLRRCFRIVSKNKSYSEDTFGILLQSQVIYFIYNLFRENLKLYKNLLLNLFQSQLFIGHSFHVNFFESIVISVSSAKILGKKRIIIYLIQFVQYNRMFSVIHRLLNPFSNSFITAFVIHCKTISKVNCLHNTHTYF